MSDAQAIPFLLVIFFWLSGNRERRWDVRDTEEEAD